MNQRTFNRPKLPAFLLALILLPAMVYGQKSLTIDLNGARKHALEYNKSLMNAGLAITKSSLALREAIANGLPQINASADYSNSLGASISIKLNPEMPAAEIPIKPQSNLYLNVGQLLFSGNYYVGIQLAKLGESLTSMNYDRTKLEVLAQVSDAYHLVLISKEMLSIMKQNAENLSELYEKMEAMEIVGIIEKTDVDQISVQVNTLNNAVKSTERQLELATNMLRLILGLDADTELVLTESLSNLLDMASLEASLIKSFDLQGNIDYQIMQQQVLISEKMVNMQKANIFANTFRLLQIHLQNHPARFRYVTCQCYRFANEYPHLCQRSKTCSDKTGRN